MQGTAATSCNRALLFAYSMLQLTSAIMIPTSIPTFHKAISVFRPPIMHHTEKSFCNIRKKHLPYKSTYSYQ